MHYHINRNEQYSLGTIPLSDYGITIAHITVDTHSENSHLDQAIHHLYGDALLSGAGKYSREEFLHALSLLGASMTATVGNGRLTITLRSTAKVFEKLLELAKIALSAPTFSPTELDRIRSVVKNELHIKQEQSSIIAREELCNDLYEAKDRRHTASVATIIRTISKVTPIELHSYHTRVLQNTWTCTIAGEESQIKAFSKFVSTLKGTTPSTLSVGTHAQKPPHCGLSLRDIPSRSNIDFSIGVPVPITIHHPDYIPMVFGLGVLGVPGGFAGRLMSTVREKEGLTYGIYAQVESFTGTELGYVRIGTFFTPEKSIQALTSTFRELKKFYKDGITQAEFDTFQTIFKTKQTLLQDSPMKQLSDLHTFNQNGFSVEEIVAFKDKINTITRAQVNAVIKRYFDPKSFFISGAGPTSKVKEDIQKFSQSIA
jgi:zinc protease